MRAAKMLAVYGYDRDEIPTSALAAAFESVAAELRLVDAADYIAYIHQEKFANIQDIVSSSVELYFQPGTLTFGWGAQYELDWNSTPIIKLEMEFRYRSVWLVFKLVLAEQQDIVTVDHLSLGRTDVSSKQSYALLMEAIAAARLRSPNR
jgi:hypothetical protein